MYLGRTCFETEIRHWSLNRLTRQTRRTPKSGGMPNACSARPCLRVFPPIDAHVCDGRPPDTAHAGLAADGHALRGRGHRAVRRGKAMRDALFLTSLDVTALPAMLIATSVVLDPAGRLQRAVRAADRRRRCSCRPRSSSAACSVPVEWILRSSAPTTAAVIVYLHISGGRTAARVRLLADRQRAVRSAHGQEAIRPDRRRRHAGRLLERRSSPSAWPPSSACRRCCRSSPSCSSSARGSSDGWRSA